MPGKASYYSSPTLQEPGDGGGRGRVPGLPCCGRMLCRTPPLVPSLVTLAAVPDAGRYMDGKPTWGSRVHRQRMINNNKAVLVNPNARAERHRSGPVATQPRTPSTPAQRDSRPRLPPSTRTVSA